MADIDELKKVLMEIAKARLTIQDMRNMGNIAMRHRKQDFNSGKDPDGKQWRKLADTTIRSKKRRGLSDPEKPLIAKGDMRDMYVGSVSKDKVVLKYANSRTKAVWNGKSIAQIHEEGTDKIPARKHMAISAGAVEDIKEYFDIRVKDEWKKIMRKVAKL